MGALERSVGLASFHLLSTECRLAWGAPDFLRAHCASWTSAGERRAHLSCLGRGRSSLVTGFSSRNLIANTSQVLSLLVLCLNRYWSPHRNAVQLFCWMSDSLLFGGWGGDTVAFVYHTSSVPDSPVLPSTARQLLCWGALPELWSPSLLCLGLPSGLKWLPGGHLSSYRELCPSLLSSGKETLKKPLA